MEGTKEAFTDQLDLLVSLQEEGHLCYRLLAEGPDTHINELFIHCSSAKKDELIDLQALLLVIEEDPEAIRESSLFDPQPFADLKEANKKLDLSDRVHACLQNEELTISAYNRVIRWMKNSNIYPKMQVVFEEHVQALGALRDLLVEEYENLNPIKNHIITNLKSQLS